MINDFLNASIINKDQAKALKVSVNQILNHPKLKDYFSSDLTIYNERDILSKQGQILRPDRLVINSNNDVTIIDYKTGDENNMHKQQLQSYEDILKTMEYKIKKKILVYINDTIQVKEI